ncbi:hypothetical protein SEA_LUMOS_81 [Mycobacterium phage Lumos]|uniref:Uncharacterized protein n=1 Tax=Mycobacterium phage Lumos TaxID=1701852 RepID=A0A0K2CLU2_9CAUD|nr:hypothetical protein AVU96_gp100 [Mycobacterium phage Snenia]YP_010012538.1 hypothetical protein J4T93_gp098 [Mycobacterium phage Lumos]ASM62816.1 hypothetical protein SEA_CLAUTASTROPHE_79 [Mycobacterium phage Clautastrophe]QDF16664.1 hypothetical protein PBI_MSGREEN_81 [Mycobacterium phage MsGreen]QPL14963.1 hypothetical protein SEA_JUBIE_80 [Mycobacterium phage Jubie]ALA06596.1 hypothetical protein SEA_LUMOS_81 [Mycobacterium phage Lumos]ALF01535.1 hypothetical protein SNENIA_80 [Mycobac
MLLSTKIKLDCGVLDYSYNPVADNHCVKFQAGCTRGMWVKLLYKPGEVISAIAPYRGHPDVDALCSWLQSQAKLPRYVR